jgi:hypothetical protein
MIDPDTLDALIGTYEKHGWGLRRVLLSKNARLLIKSDRFARDVAVVDSDIDAAWFSRPPRPGGVAWEIRYLGEIQFAIVENIDENSPDFEHHLAAVEKRLTETISSKRNA